MEHDWGRGDLSALDRLAPLEYPQLWSLARSFLRRERPGAVWFRHRYSERF